MSRMKIVEIGTEASNKNVKRGGIELVEPNAATGGNADSSSKEKVPKGGIELIGLKSITSNKSLIP